MKLVITLLAISLSPLTASTETGSLTPEHLIKFNNAFAPFFRRYCGCPEHATDPAECSGKGYIDYALYIKSREAAKKLFDLKERD